MKRFHIIATVLTVFLLATTACVNDDSDFEQLLAAAEDAQPVKLIDIALDFSPLDEADDEIPTDPNDETYNDYVENATLDRTIYLEWNGDEVVASGETRRVTMQQDGGHVTIISSSTRLNYVLKGNTDNGSFKIYSDHKFQLTLDGVSITNPNGAAINDQCGKTVYLVLNDGTTNTLCDGSTYDIPTGEQMKGTFFSEGQIIVSGKGRLDITATGGHGFVSDDYIRFRPGCNLYVNCNAGNGIKSNDGVYIDGGVINVEVSADGAKGIKCDAGINVRGGRTTILTTGATLLSQDELTAANDTSSCAAIRCDSIMAVEGGQLLLKSSGEGGKGINCASAIAISGGSVKVATTGKKGNASPKGIKSDGTITVTGGYVYVYSAAGSPLDATGGLVTENKPSTYITSKRGLIIGYTTQE